jgi:signal peptidase
MNSSGTDGKAETTMGIRSTVGTVITGILVILAMLIVGTQVLGFASPVGYVETDSMEPQLEPGDGYIGVPKPLAGDIEPNDVVTYEAQSLGGGGLTTHRVIKETDGGYITKGDNNPFTDQDGPEPPVTEAQIKLVVATVNGNVVAIPHLGDVALAAQGVISTAITILGLKNFSTGSPAIIITGIGLLFIIVAGASELITGENTRSMERSTRRSATLDSRLLLAGIILILALPVMSVTALPSGTQDLSILSTERAHPDDASMIKAGTATELNSTVKNSQMFPMVVILEPASDGVEFSEQVLTVSPGGKAKTRLRLSAPRETGPYVRARSKTFYIRVLPTGLIAGLHRIHPLFARLATMGVIFAPVIVIYWVVVGFRSITLRDTQQ